MSDADDFPPQFFPPSRAIKPPTKVEPGGHIPAPGTTQTDLGNAERFAEHHGDRLRHCPTLGGWYHWSGYHWARDETAEAQRLAHETVRHLYLEVKLIADELTRERDKERRQHLEAMLEEARRHAKRSEASRSIRAMLHEASAIRPIPTAWSSFDAPSTALLLNTPSATIDLRTGAPRPHRREDLITKVTGVPYSSTAEAPRFERFLAQVLPDPDVRAFMQRWAGYCATGVIREHVLPVWYGEGGNGKGTLAELLKFALGDYAIGTPDGFFEEQKHRGHQTEIARLRGARLAIASETKASANLDEAKVKKLTGGDSLTGNYMRQDHFTFEPTCKFVLFTNHKPRIRSTDEGIRRRILLVPFTVSIPAEERVLSLREQIQAEEGPGILRWIVEGARELLARDGQLAPPAIVQAATEEYLATEDTVGRFLEEGCTVRPPGDRTIRSTPAHLFEAYQRWCSTNGEGAAGQRDFRTRLGKRGYTSVKGNGSRWYLGVAPLELSLDNHSESQW